MSVLSKKKNGYQVHYFPIDKPNKKIDVTLFTSTQYFFR